MTDTLAEPFEFTAPGPGGWMYDATHHGLRPVTRFLRPAYEHAVTVGMPEMFVRYGLPLAGVRLGFVHGCAYMRIMGIGEPDRPKGEPPKLVLKVLARVHPELRRRNRTAAEALRDQRWRQDVDQWFERDRAGVVELNRRLQAVDLAGLDDHALLAHLDDCLAHFRTTSVDSFRYHGGDIIPAGLFLAACAGWGADVAEAAALFRGASPATLENDRLLAPVARAIATAPAPPTSIAEIRALGREVSALVDTWLDDQGWRVLSSDDVDAPTLAERDDLQLRALLAAKADRQLVEPPDPTPVRDRVPEADRDRFDALLDEARHGFTLRDDHVGVRWNWPVGLIRRALLEAGGRMVERGLVHDARHVVELDPDEVGAALAGSGPSADELAQRRAYRDAVEQFGPPSFLGEPGGEAPLDAFPAPLATITGAALSVIGALNADPEGTPLHGLGIGDQVYRGRACVVGSPVDAHDRLEDGDVLVVPFTSPSYDSLFALVGAVVTDHGGPMSHTAIMAREFGVPAVIGAPGSTSTIPDGATVEVDPVAGRVSVLAVAAR